jgi:hypothetical protein
MVNHVSHHSGTDSAHGVTANPGVPAVYSMPVDMESHDSFHSNRGGHGNGHGAGGGNFFQRMWHKITNPIVQMFKDAIALPGAIWKQLFGGGHHGDHGEAHGPNIPFIAQSGVLSGNVADETIAMPPGPNPYLAQEGFLSGRTGDENLEAYTRFTPPHLAHGHGGGHGGGGGGGH